MTPIYPKAQSPVTPTVLAMANARADRWLNRYREASARVAELEAEREAQR